MILPRTKHSCRRRPAPVPLQKETLMTWTTPTASDFRFGFEITMYVAAR